MAKASNLPSETTMYSINPSGGVVVHHLPWARTSPQLEHYVQKGFMFEKPEGYEITGTPKKVEAVAVKEVEVVREVENKCSICGKVCKSEFGLVVHKRSHKRK